MLLIFVPIFLLALAAFFGPPAVSKPAVAAIKTIAVVMDRSTPPQVAAPPVRCWHDSIGAVPSAYTLDEPMTPDGYPTTSLDRVSIRGWLTGGFYGPLDTMLIAYADSARADFRLENRMQDVFEAFNDAEPTLDFYLEEWQRQDRRSGNVHILRGYHYLAQAWKVRGTRWAKETADSNRLTMTRFVKRARVQADSALLLAPCSLPAYMLPIRLAQLGGQTRLSEDALEQALRLQPYAFEVRALHMANLQPRWGGSFKEMHDFAESIDPLVRVNPRLRLLHGFEYAERASVLEDRSASVQSVLAAYDSAFAYGDHWRFRADRGNYFYRHNRNAEAGEDFDVALGQRPQDLRSILGRASVWYEVGRTGDVADKPSRYAEVRRLSDLALQIAPADPTAISDNEFYRKSTARYVGR